MTLTQLIWHIVQWQPPLSVAFEPYGCQTCLLCKVAARLMLSTVIILIYALVTQDIYEPFLIMYYLGLLYKQDLLRMTFSKHFISSSRKDCLIEGL
jgi:hypothetical protein